MSCNHQRVVTPQTKHCKEECTHREDVESQSPSYLHSFRELLQLMAANLSSFKLQAAHCAVTRATIYYLLTEANLITT